MIAIALSKDLDRRLDELASLTGQSKAALIVEYVEDADDTIAAQRALEEYAASRSRTSSMSEVLARYG